MKRAPGSSVAPLALTLTLWASAAQAIPIIAVDLDPYAPGVQSTLTVDPGDLFTIAIVYVSDGQTVFDAVELGVAFNDAGNVLGLGLGVTPGDARFGNLVGLASGLVQEIDTFDLAFVGAPMHPDGTFTPPVGFAEGVGGFGYTVVHPGVFLPGPGGTITPVLTLAFVALFPGESAICPEPFSPFLFLDGVGVDARQAPGFVTVLGAETPVPEPASVWLLFAGLAGLGLIPTARGR